MSSIATSSARCVRLRRTDLGPASAIDTRVCGVGLLALRSQGPLGRPRRRSLERDVLEEVRGACGLECRQNFDEVFGTTPPRCLRLRPRRAGAQRTHLKGAAKGSVRAAPRRCSTPPRSASPRRSRRLRRGRRGSLRRRRLVRLGADSKRFLGSASARSRASRRKAPAASGAARAPSVSVSHSAGMRSVATRRPFASVVHSVNSGSAPKRRAAAARRRRGAPRRNSMVVLRRRPQIRQRRLRRRSCRCLRAAVSSRGEPMTWVRLCLSIRRTYDAPWVRYGSRGL